MTRNGKIFAALFLLYSVGFHWALSAAIEDARYESIWKLAVVYGVGTFVTALLLGAFDPVRRSRGVLAFHYHLITYVISVTVGLLWMVTGLAAPEEHSKPYVFSMMAWGVGLLLHYAAARNTIKGISKGELFE